MTREHLVVERGIAERRGIGRQVGEQLERVPALAYTWGLYDQRIGINQVVLPGETVSWAARWVGDPKSKVVFRSTFHHGKERMLSDLWDLWDQADALSFCACAYSA